MGSINEKLEEFLVTGALGMNADIDEIKLSFFAGAIAMGTLHTPILAMARRDTAKADAMTDSLIEEAIEYLSIEKQKLGIGRKH